MKIGVLAIQGSVKEHKVALENAAANLKVSGEISDFEVVEVRLPEDVLEISPDGSTRFLNIQGIILPGGESTTQSKLLKRYGLFEVLRDAINGDLNNQEKLPVWGTCAGAILLAKEVSGQPSENDTGMQQKALPDTLSVMDIHADRNAYGSQIDSFATTVDMDLRAANLTNPFVQPVEAVFIRAPKLTPLSDIDTSSIQILASHNDMPIALQQDNMLVTSFHPELTDDISVHAYFIQMCMATSAG